VEGVPCDRAIFSRLLSSLLESLPSLPLGGGSPFDRAIGHVAFDFLGHLFELRALGVADLRMGSSGAEGQ